MAQEPDWEPFSSPNDAKPRQHRVGVVDIGSNSVRLVVFDGAARSPAYFFNEKVMCGLGAGLAETGRLNPQGRVACLAALRRFALLAKGMDLTLHAVATAAMRDATDGPAFRADIEAETGLTVHVIDGAEEARLSAQGVLLGWPGSYGLVCDIGGASMELAEIQGGAVGRCATSALGPLKFKDLAPDARRAHIDAEIARLAEAFGAQRDRLFLVGGSWRAIARIDIARRKYPLHVLHEYRMDATSVIETLEHIAAQDPDSLRKKSGVSASRMALVPYAAEVLGRVIDTFEPHDIALSSYGIREGLLYEHMPQALRDRDPLIEACRFAEARDARLPGFGKRLYQFILPLFPDADPEMRRLIQAACLLHDVSWRAHPDYRAEICFDNATRSNLGGMKHWERIFLGMALLHRYRNKREGTRFEALYALLTDRHMAMAEVLGKALRFGAMLWVSEGTDIAARLHWAQTDRRLSLIISPEAVPLFGEVARHRFQALAAAMGAETVVAPSL